MLATYGGGFALVCAAAFMGSSFLKADRAEAISRFSLTEMEVPVMQACEATVSRHNIEFVSGVDNITGCGCIARQISDAAPDGSLAALTAVTEVVISGGDSDTTPADFEAAMLAAQAEHGLSMTTLERHLDQVTAAIDHCSKPESHLTPEQLAEVEATRKAHYEKSKVAFERAVADGLITRAEADRRLATLQ